MAIRASGGPDFQMLTRLGLLKKKNLICRTFIGCFMTIKLWMDFEAHGAGNQSNFTQFYPYLMENVKISLKAARVFEKS